MTAADTRPDIPLGFTFDIDNNVIAFKDHSGFWWERTYDDNGKVLTHKDSVDYWREYTRDDNGKVRTYKDSYGVEWTAIAHTAYYTLGYDSHTHKYHAGCRVFTRAEALAHWGTPRFDNAARAAIFIAAINNHKETT